VAGQLCKAAGCRVIGIAGSARKCAIAVDEFGFDACVNYRDADFQQILRATCPDGIDGYFYNVGGAVLEAALALREHAISGAFPQRWRPAARRHPPCRIPTRAQPRLPPGYLRSIPSATIGGPDPLRVAHLRNCPKRQR